jgi:hypothetical protein
MALKNFCLRYMAFFFSNLALWPQNKVYLALWPSVSFRPLTMLNQE